ncbi:MAG: porin family protein [Candidatus Aminicenantes bacterium]|nr:porin family protein [Candidatus Aminicenantes bacterium]
MSVRTKFSAGLVSALAIACLLGWPSTAAGADETGSRTEGISFTFPQATPDYTGGATNASRFSLRLYGGFSRIGAADLNAGFDGYYELIELYEALGFGTVTGGYTPLKNGFNGGADVIYQITPRIGIGVGAGYLRTSANSLATLSIEEDVIDFPATATLSAIPIRLGVFLAFPLGGKLNLTADAGAAYYAALKLDATQRLEFDDGDWLEMSINAQRSSFANLGFQGSLGLEYMVSPKMGLFVEALGRYARFKNFETATGSNRNSDGDSDSTEGKIYLMTKTFTEGSWSMFTVEETPPVSSPPSTVFTEPKIDLSGFSLQAGIRIRF